MSKFEKSLERLLSKPKDYHYQELKTVLYGLGYVEKKNNGSRRKFISEQQHVLILHAPHPSPIVKRYILTYVIEHLQQQGLI